MTEVPEHLLRRSRERRAALGLGGGDAAADPGQTPAAGAAPSPADTPAGAPALVKTTPAPPSYTGPAPLPPRRNLIPMWVAPVLMSLPVWAFFYFGALGDKTISSGPTDPVELGAELFRSKGCSGCHGSGGEGGVGPKLAGGEVLKTFPDEADHIDWVTHGSIGDNKPYGDPGREGGQHKSRGGMPAFGSSLSPEEIAAVVAYEREGL